jgi:hypothetical protein
MIKDGTTVLFEDVFHIHSGYLNLYLQYNNQTSKWSYVENSKDKIVGIWRFNNDETYTIQKPPPDYGRFNEVQLFTVYDDTYNFHPKEKPRFGFQLLIDQHGDISDDRNKLLPAKIASNVTQKCKETLVKHTIFIKWKFSLTGVLW